jgi:hypothetical protein
MPEPMSRDPTTRDRAMSVAAISSERIESDENAWTRRLVLFLRVMAVLSMGQGLYHWAQVTGFVGTEDEAFEVQSMAWQTSTVYFAVIELVGAVGLWLATPWGAVVWLTTVVSMAVIELMFPTIYGGNLLVAIARRVGHVSQRIRVSSLAHDAPVGFQNLNFRRASNDKRAAPDLRRQAAAIA